MNRKTFHWMAAAAVTLLVIAAFGAAAVAQEAERKSVAVRHPNLLLNNEATGHTSNWAKHTFP